MFCKVYSALCMGIQGRIVRVEADMSSGLPSFQIVGEISAEVRESGARIRTAMKNSGTGSYVAGTDSTEKYGVFHAAEENRDQSGACQFPQIRDRV